MKKNHRSIALCVDCECDRPDEWMDMQEVFGGDRAFGGVCPACGQDVETEMDGDEVFNSCSVCGWFGESG